MNRTVYLDALMLQLWLIKGALLLPHYEGKVLVKSRCVVLIEGLGRARWDVPLQRKLSSSVMLPERGQDGGISQESHGFKEGPIPSRNVWRTKQHVHEESFHCMNLISVLDSVHYKFLSVLQIS